MQYFVNLLINITMAPKALHYTYSRCQEGIKSGLERRIMADQIEGRFLENEAYKRIASRSARPIRVSHATR